MTTLNILAPEFVKRFQSGEIPSSARVTVTYEEQEGDMSKSPDLALIEEWLSQAPTEADEILAAEDDLHEFQTALNQSRRSAGARIPYPSVQDS